MLARPVNEQFVSAGRHYAGPSVHNANWSCRNNHSLISVVFVEVHLSEASPPLWRMLGILACTVKGELGVASFLVNFFKRGPFLDISSCAPLPSCTFRYRC
jgi:hypothetical protein